MEEKKVDIFETHKVSNRKS